jgi:ABC-type branched-subunit amino acid transport system substrate-binding protein
MRKLRLSLSCLGVLALVATACGRGDDSGSDTTTAATAAATTVAATDAATTAPEATTATTAGEAEATTEAPTTTVAGTPEGYAKTAADIEEQCKSEPLEATDVGVSESEITIEVMADTGSPLAPGLFQGNIDAIKAFGDYINANGGIGCRKLVVRTWDSKLDPTESKNGLIDSCANAVAMVGNNSLFNPDVSAMTGCVDKAGAATGLPNIAALANDVTELCGATTYVIQAQAESCPVNVGQPRDFKVFVGNTNKLLELNPGGLHGVFMIPGDLPTTRQSAVSLIAGQELAGVVYDGKVLVSGRDEQAAYTPRVQILKENNGNYVYDGSNDVAMIKMQKETQAQGLDPKSIVWSCSLACYTKNMREQGGDTAEGTYVWMQFLPFEEADTNAAMQNYVDTIGADNVVSWGAQAWQAGIAFQQVVNQIVADQGPNAITRANILAGLNGLTDFTADGWAGAKSLHDMSDCYLLMQLQGGKFVRVWPEERGTLDCDAANINNVTVEPVSAAAAFG